MNKTTKLLSGIALLFSLTAYASAGAIADLKSSADTGAELKIAVPVPVAVSPAPGSNGDVQAVEYFTGVDDRDIVRFVQDFYQSDRTTVVYVALDEVLTLPVNRSDSQYQGLGIAFTVMASGVAAEMPAANWKIMKKYNGILPYEFPAAISHIVRDIEQKYMQRDTVEQLLEITKQDGLFTIKVKRSPWASIR